MKKTTALKNKILSRKAKISIIGMGYVGLPLACEFSKKGFYVTGVDLDVRKVQSIQKGKCYIDDIPQSEMGRLVKSGHLKASVSFDSLEQSDVVIICVPTPLNRIKDPDISYIVDATHEIETRLHSQELVILESTTYPGTTDEIILPALEKSGLKVGKDFFLCFSPERIDPGNEKYKTADIPKVVGGITPTCSELAALLYGQITPQVIKVSSSRTAEMTKLLENTFRIVNIGLVNELARSAEKLKVNIWEAIDAAKTKPFGYMPFYPGPGIGGHCIGIDPLYLSWKARTQGQDLHFIELARRVNAEMPDHVVSQAVFALNKYQGKAISKSKVLVIGISYKKDVPDIRESPALDILHKLKLLGAKLQYHDPYVPEITHEGISLKSTALTRQLLRSYDLVILTTNHSKLNYKLIVQNSRLIFDTRNALKNFSDNHIVRL